MSVSSDTYPKVLQSHSPPYVPSLGTWWSAPRKARTFFEGSRCDRKPDCTSSISRRDEVQLKFQWNGICRSHKLLTVALKDHGMMHASSIGNADLFEGPGGTIWDRSFWEARWQMRIDIMSDVENRKMTITTLNPSIPWNFNAACFLCLHRLGGVGDELVRASWTRTDAAPFYHLHSKCIPASTKTPYVTDPGAERFWWDAQTLSYLYQSVSHIPQQLDEGKLLMSGRPLGPQVMVICDCNLCRIHRCLTMVLSMRLQHRVRDLHTQEVSSPKDLNMDAKSDTNQDLYKSPTSEETSIKLAGRVTTCPVNSVLCLPT